MGKVQIRAADDGGNVFLLHPALEHHIGNIFVADPPLQRFTLVAVAPDQKLDAGIFHTLRRIQQQTEVVDPTDGAGIDDLKDIRIVQVGIFHAEMLFIIVKLLQIDAVVDVVYLGAGDLLLPALLDDVIVGALHGEHQGIGFLIDPLLAPIQELDQGVILREAIGVHHDALRPEIPHLADALHAELLRQLDACHQRQRMDGGGKNHVGPAVLCGVLLCGLLHIAVEVDHIQHALLAVAGVGAGADKNEGRVDLLGNVLLPQRVGLKEALGLAVLAVGTEDNGRVTGTAQIFRKVIVPTALVEIHITCVVV